MTPDQRRVFGERGESRVPMVELLSRRTRRLLEVPSPAAWPGSYPTHPTPRYPLQLGPGLSQACR